MAVRRLPLAGKYNERFPEQFAGTRTDQAYKNCYPETLDKEDISVVKRPGLQASGLTIPSAVGRGIIKWKGDTWTVAGNKVYKNGTAISGTLNTSTGAVGMDFAADGSGLLVINDTGDIYTVNTSDTLTTLSDADIPSAMLPGVVVLDQYCFVMDSDGVIYNSDEGDVTSWDALGFLTAEVRADDGKRIIRHGNYLCALGERTVEFYYNADNPAPGSPLTRLEGTASLVGTQIGMSAVSIGDEIYYISNHEGGGYSVSKFKGFESEPVSNKFIDEAIYEEAYNSAAATFQAITCFATAAGGHTFYVVPLADYVGRCFAYDIAEQTWSEWTQVISGTEGIFRPRYAYNTAGISSLLDGTNGAIYYFASDVYQDAGEDIKVEGRTKIYDEGTSLTKYLHRLEVIGDMSTTDATDLGISYSDDDYATWSTERTVDLNDQRPYLTRLGRFERRAFKYTFENNKPMRLKAFEMHLRQGHYAQ